MGIQVAHQEYGALGASTLIRPYGEYRELRISHPHLTSGSCRRRSPLGVLALFAAS